MAVSVILPIYNQSRFVLKSINSLIVQTFKDWELIIVDDGSTDNLVEVLGSVRSANFLYVKTERNEGLGYALNVGIRRASFDYVAYLPADDIYFREHLITMVNALNARPDAAAVFSGVKHHYTDSAFNSDGHYAYGYIPGLPLQLVQVMHRKTEIEWTERAELVTDDLNAMYWDKLKRVGDFVYTNRLSCEWTSHPHQRHRLINEQYEGGGIYRYKQYYNVQEPLRFQSMSGYQINEHEDYKPVRTVRSGNHPEGLKIVLAGELAYNADRILALEEHGHTLYGLWMDNPQFYNTVGPLPFGHVKDIPRESWKQAIETIKPDIIYGLLNHTAIPFVHKVMLAFPEIPFVWHFKESPFYARQLGTWDKLIDLFELSDGAIYINPECKSWFDSCTKPDIKPVLILDGDLPHKVYFADRFSKKLSKTDGKIHTVVVGRPVGIQVEDVRKYVEQDIHIHLYGNYASGHYRSWYMAAKSIAFDHLHLHPTCSACDWTQELSKYDAGWLHLFESINFGDEAKVDWNDLNYPARISTLAAAGLPMIHKNNSLHQVATESLTRQYDIGVRFDTCIELKDKLSDRAFMDKLTENSCRHRDYFKFNTHVDGLVDFFREVIKHSQAKRRII